jgi:serine/threonine protein kinase
LSPRVFHSSHAALDWDNLRTVGLLAPQNILDLSVQKGFGIDPMVAAAQTQDVFDLVGTVLDGRFQIDRIVAEGGFGIVYHGHQLALDRAVAVKALKVDDAQGRLSDFRERFAAEAKTMARLRHPNIADVYDFGITRLASGTDLPWIALEWLDGRTLESILHESRGRGGLFPGEALALMKPALEAFAHAHRQGVAHRDIKPSNMIRTKDASAFTLRVLDFGISKIMLPEESAGSGRTRTADGYAFSPAYASPEQISGGRSGPWTDVHALGLVLTEVLTDQPPVEGAETEIDLYARLLSVDRPTPESKGKSLGPWDSVLAKALALQPSSRWKDAGELLEALMATVDEADRTARPPGSEASALDTRQRMAATIVRPNPPRESGATGAIVAVSESRTAENEGRRPTTSGEGAAPLNRSRRRIGGLLVVVSLAVAAAFAVWAQRSSAPTQALAEETKVVPREARPEVPRIAAPPATATSFGNASPPAAATAAGRNGSGAASSVSVADSIGQRKAPARRTAKPELPPNGSPVRSRAAEKGLIDENPLR